MAEMMNAQAQSSAKGLDAGKQAEAKVPAGQTQGSNDLIYADRVTPEFCQKVKKISSNIGVDPNHLMACMCFETGGEFKAKWYKSSNAVGLIQFTQAAVDELNVNPQLAPKAKTSKNALSQMTEIEQLDYVEKYFLIHKTKYKRSMSNVADLYMAIFCPAGVGKKDDYVLYKKGTKAYSSNNGLDKNKDGLITKAEAASKPMQKLQEGFQEQEDRNAPDIGSGTIKLQKDPTLSMRSGAGRGFQVIGKIPNGASFTYIKENNGWLRIRYNGKMGWISKQYTLLDSATNAAMPTSTSLAVADNTATPVAKPSTTKPQDTAAPTAATTVVEQSQESASPVPKPAKEAPVAPEAAPKVADVLSTTKAAEAVKWYTDNKFTADLIQRIQAVVGIANPSTTMTPSAVQAVAAWQKLKGCTYVDGEFGNGSAAKTNDAQLKADIEKLLPLKKSTATSKQNGRVYSKRYVTKNGKEINARFMAKGLTPDLSKLQEDAVSYETDLDVSKIPDAARYVARCGMSEKALGQCTRGIALYLQLASYARGQAKRTYASACAAHLFGSTNALTNYNISSSVASEFSISKGSNTKGKSNMSSQISNNLKKDGEFVTFKYADSQHIVFRANSGWYSDFKQGTATGCGGETTTYSNVHYFKL